MPPMKAAGATTPPAVAGASGSGFAVDAPKAKGGGPDSSVGGATGQASAGATALGGGGALAGVLQQLMEAVKALSAAISGITGGGGSPMQVGPGGKPGQVDGGGGLPPDPLTGLDKAFAKALARTDLTPAQRTELEPIRAELAAARTAANTTGSLDPTTLLGIDMKIDRATLPADSPGRAKLGALLLELPKASQGGVFNPAMINRISLESDLVSGGIKPGSEAAAQRLIDTLRAMEGSPSFNPVDLQRISLESAAISVPR